MQMFSQIDVPEKVLYNIRKTKKRGAQMKNVLLVGDSIRMGYDKAIRSTLNGKANVYFPEENCLFPASLKEYRDAS